MEEISTKIYSKQIDYGYENQEREIEKKRTKSTNKWSKNKTAKKYWRFLREL